MTTTAVTPDAVYEQIAGLLATAEYRYQRETGLQEGLAARLASGGVEHQREVELGPGARIDILTADGLGIEVKTRDQDTLGSVHEQLGRYAGFHQVHGLLLVTTRARLARLARITELHGKPLRVLVLRGGLR